MYINFGVVVMGLGVADAVVVADAGVVVDLEVVVDVYSSLYRFFLFPACSFYFLKSKTPTEFKNHFNLT